MKNNNVRKIVPINMDLAAQRDLFEIATSPGSISPYNQTFEVFDLLPIFAPDSRSIRYHFNLSAEEKTRTLAYEDFDANGKVMQFDILIKPAEIELHSSVRKKIAREKGIPFEKSPTHAFVYPGTREEKVQEVLKKLAVDGNGVYDHEKTGVHFSQSQIKKELERHGKTMSLVEIGEALDVMHYSHLEIKQVIEVEGKKQTQTFSSPFFPARAKVEREEWENDLSQCYIQFYGLITNQIRGLRFRQSNHNQRMNLENYLARYLHKRMTVKYKKAVVDEDIPYEFNLTTLFKWAGKRINEKQKCNKADVDTACDELVERKILKHYNCVAVKDQRDQRITLDYKYYLFAGEELVVDMRKAKAVFDINERRCASADARAELSGIRESLSG